MKYDEISPTVQKELLNEDIMTKLLSLIFKESWKVEEVPKNIYPNFQKKGKYGAYKGLTIRLINSYQSLKYIAILLVLLLIIFIYY